MQDWRARSMSIFVGCAGTENRIAFWFWGLGFSLRSPREYHLPDTQFRSLRLTQHVRAPSGVRVHDHQQAVCDRHHSTVAYRPGRAWHPSSSAVPPLLPGHLHHHRLHAVLPRPDFPRSVYAFAVTADHLGGMDLPARGHDVQPAALDRDVPGTGDDEPHRPTFRSWPRASRGIGRTRRPASAAGCLGCSLARLPCS